MLQRELGVQKALAASEMELGEFLKEMVCCELCWGAGVTALQAPAVFPSRQALQGARLVENWLPPLQGAAVCRYLHAASSPGQEKNLLALLSLWVGWLHCLFLI